MRSDKKLGVRARDLDRGRFGEDLGERNSLSGHERDHLFVREGDNFLDLSGLSGMDHEGDGRAFGLLDQDRDGWQDLIVVNANAPMVLFFRNQLGNAGVDAGMVALRFVGGNHTAQAAPASPRDGFGARVLAQVGSRRLRRDLSCGEGFASQNSATLLLGIGNARKVDALTVRWPSGRTSEVRGIPEGTLLTVYEDPAQSPDGSGELRVPYRVFSTEAATPPNRAPASDRLLADVPDARSPAKLSLFTSTATWCAACKKALPQLERLRAAFPPEELALFGVPVDPNDTPAMLARYLVERKPAYRLLAGLTADQVAEVKRHIHSAFRSEPLPTTLVCDAAGRLLTATLGIPSVSDVRRWLDGLGN